MARAPLALVRYAAMHILTVDAAEEGMKLISFLAKRLGGGASQNELHRWIRTGQVRVNKSRARAFDRLSALDAVRLPPFAAPPARADADTVPVTPGEDLGRGVRVIAVTRDFLALDKPARLPTQPGSGHTASVVSVLRERFASSAYIPAPVHRLDKETSGLLLAGRTHMAQEQFHALFASRDMEKTYLAWIAGEWPHDTEQPLCDSMAKEDAGTDGGLYETMRVTAPGAGKPASCRVTLLERRAVASGPASLLRVILETGRTHQVRVQLASRGYPVVGDVKYGGRRFSRMLLHAHSLDFSWRGERAALLSYPDWPEPFTAGT